MTENEFVKFKSSFSVDDFDGLVGEATDERTRIILACMSDSNQKVVIVKDLDPYATAGGRFDMLKDRPMNDLRLDTATAASYFGMHCNSDLVRKSLAAEAIPRPEPTAREGAGLRTKKP